MKIRENIKNNIVLIKNFSYLSIIKLVTILLPILTYPYLINKLGLEKYGLLVYSQAIIGYFVIIINFGFNITTTREISRNRNNLDKLSDIISSTYAIKIFLFFISFIILFLLSLFIPDIHKYFNLFVFTMLWLALYEVFFPIYYFQGTEKMKYITIVTLISRLFFFVCIFLFIEKESDYIYFPIINFLGSIISIIISFKILFKEGIRIKKPKKSDVIYHIKTSYIMGLAVGSNTLKSNLNIVLIKNILSFNEVAIFDLASKLVNIGITLTDLISQTVFPKLAKEKNKIFFRKILMLVGVFSFICVLGVIIFGQHIISLLGNNKMNDAYPILIIMSLIIPIYSIGTILGRNCLNVFGYDKHVLFSMLFSSLIYVFLFYLVYDVFKIDIAIKGFVLLYLVSFLFDTLYRFVICKKYNLF